MESHVNILFRALGEVDGPSLRSTRKKDAVWFSANNTNQCLRGSQLLDAIDGVASYMDANTSSKTVVLLAGNNLATALTVLAAMRHRMILAILPSNATSDEIQKTTTKLNSDSCVFSTESADPSKITTSVIPIDPEKCLTGDKKQFEHDADTAEDEKSRPFLITFTSGSTGEPKGVIHPATSFISCGLEFSKIVSTGENDTYLNVMPMYYMAGLFNGLIGPLSAKSNVVISNQFGTMSAMYFWKMVKEFEVSAVWLAPTMLQILIKLDRSNAQSRSQHLKLFVGTGKLSEDLAHETQEKYGIVPLQSYGLSELLYIAVDDVNQYEFGSAGFILPSVQLKLEQEGLGDTSANHGLASFRTPFACLKYLMPDGNYTDPFDDEGYFKTSDLVEIKNQSSSLRRLTVKARNDDLIIRGGVNIDPYEIENYLKENLSELVERFYLSTPDDFCVVGIPDKDLGQAVCLVCSGWDLNSETKHAIRLEISKLPSQKTRIDRVYTLLEMPKGPTGKLQRQKIIELCKLEEH